MDGTRSVPTTLNRLRCETGKSFPASSSVKIPGPVDKRPYNYNMDSECRLKAVPRKRALYLDSKPRHGVGRTSLQRVDEANRWHTLTFFQWPAKPPSRGGEDLASS